MGFGHRVYKNYDPRAKLMQETCNEVLAELGLENDPCSELAKELERSPWKTTTSQRKLYPNVDFYSGIVQRAIGIPVNLFTGILHWPARSAGLPSSTRMISDPEYKISRPASCSPAPHAATSDRTRATGLHCTVESLPPPFGRVFLEMAMQSPRINRAGRRTIPDRLQSRTLYC